ncbi:conserved phage C-terminal domain-containing protein [Klebsiella pneumoniae]|uniref:conserved phage C-terminal domain-containing protein n=1 Tax=Klebsiella pneumoniae complex TaxID=3390273 RepID=UPI00291B4488|nr:conserved phage C-terminal domain-containing protein [Klebsiella pneumoniae]HBR4790018.1 conserved phage C-terminal domain-containing protein [Klebsiella pneumoniae]
MSSKLHGLVWEACAFKGLIISEIAVMARLADFSNDEGISWPAVTTIQRQIGAKSENTVRSAIKKLQAKGWLKKQERRVGGKNNSNVYKLNVDMLERAAAEAKLFYATPREQSKFDASEIEGSKFEGSNSDASNNGSASPQILRGDPSMVEGDPSLDPSLDPSSKKPSCRAPAEPDDKPDPEVVITDYAIEVLTYLNQVSGSRFQKSKTSLENIRARLREGHTVPDLKLVIDVKHEHWHGNDEQYQYMRPETLFGPKKFEGYLQSAIRWDAKGRPPRECWDRSKPRDINQIGAVQTTIPKGFRG